MSKTALDYSRSNVWNIPPEDLYLETTPGQNGYDPRATLPPEEHIVLGIMEEGVKLTVLVVKEEVGGKERVRVVDGRRRVVNACEANRRLVAKGLPPIRVRCSLERADEARLTKLQALTNEHRTEVDPIGKALSMHEMQERGYSAEEVAQLYNCTAKTVQNYTRLLDLTPKVQEAVRSGELPMTKALPLAGKPKAEQLAALEAPKAKRGRPKGKQRPSKAKVSGLLEGITTAPGKPGSSEDLELKAAETALLWASGDLSDEELAKRWPKLGEILKAEKEGAK